MVIRYPWDSTKYTPFQTGIPPHVMLLSEIEAMKNRMSEQTTEILDGMRTDLNIRLVRGDSYLA